ncbi:hypothetical protein RDV84_12795 [Lysobacter yananisis]|uniref:Uncharacterized protein n=1 Tax=Lysobacter yananisis TaxID=1003114 RepID=A0ABY9PF53_9GAMM|nr:MULTISPECIES: hypothetical protein [Lysobacter]UZW61830.1 hypothetical protein BV903_005890 [Lysobacter enzymogenes]WMT05677.1 hypothetical protein RDV84_12795 [Lysobacter yananisis]
MQTWIKVRRAWNAMLVAIPIEELAVIALQAVPGVRSPVIEREDMDGVVVAFDWTGPGQPDIPVEFLHRFGLEPVPEIDAPTSQEKGGGPS